MPQERREHEDQGHPHGRYGQGSVDALHSIWHDGWDWGSAEPQQYNPLMGNSGLNAYPLPGAMQVLAYGDTPWEWPVQPFWGLRTRIHTPWPGGSSFGWIRPFFNGGRGRR